jgi:hypothetical protein
LQGQDASPEKTCQYPVVKVGKTGAQKMKATPLVLVLVMVLVTILTHRQEEVYRRRNEVNPQTQKGDSGAWYRGESYPKPTMYTKYATNMKYKFNMQSYTDQDRIDEKQMQQKIYGVYVFGIKTKKKRNKKRSICHTPPLPHTL